jgi:hypothetical protein
MSQRQSIIVWSLRNGGDILSPDGDVVHLFFERVMATPQGRSAFSDFDQFDSAVRHLHNTRRIKKDKHAIRLLTKAKDMPANPFAGTDLAPFTPDNAGVDGLMAPLRGLSLSTRTALAVALNESIRDDLNSYKSVVIEGL